MTNPIAAGISFFDLRQIKRTLITYRNILEVETIEDGDSITKVSRGSQIAAAVIGGLAFCGVGMIAGALTGDKRTKQIAPNIELILVVNNLSEPVWKIKFLNHEVKKESREYNDAKEKAIKLSGIIKVLIRIADDEDKLNVPQGAPKPKEATLQNHPINPNPEKQDVVQLAKQGNTTAITDLLNKGLSPHGIAARAKINGTVLRISLGANEEPLQEKMTAIIHKGIMRIGIESIEKIEISAYQFGSTAPLWTSTLTL